MSDVLVGGYVVSVDCEQFVRSFDVFPTLHELSEFFAGRFVPGRYVLAVNVSGEEVVDTCFCAGGWVHDRVGEMLGKEVCVVWVSLDRGGDEKVACFLDGVVTLGYAGLGIVAWATVGLWKVGQGRKEGTQIISDGKHRIFKNRDRV